MRLIKWLRKDGGYRILGIVFAIFITGLMIGFILMNIYLKEMIDTAPESYVGTIEEINILSAGGFATPSMCLVTMEEGKQVKLGNVCHQIQIGSRICIAHYIWIFGDEEVICR